MASNEALLVRLEAVEAALQMAFDAVRKLRVELQSGSASFRLTTPVGLVAPTSAGLAAPALQVIPPDPQWIPILHVVPRVMPDSWPRPCGQVGLYLTEPPREHEKARLDRMRILVPGESRWREPTINDEPRCSSCGTMIDPFSNADLDYLSRMIPGGARPPALGKRRDRRRSKEEEPGLPRPEGEVSPGMSSEALSPSTFPGHTPQAQHDVLQGIEALTDFARSAGLLDDRPLRS